MEETISDKMSRARRRQSDARWRASVASCYETLRLTIPVNKRATRRIAKSAVLAETANHMDMLQTVLRSLLIKKAQVCGISNSADWIKKQIDDINSEFCIKQRLVLESVVSARKQHRARGRHLYHTQQRALKCARLNSAFYGNAAATRLPYPAVTPITQRQQDSSSVLTKTAGSDTATVGLAAARHSSVSPSDELQDFAEQLICHEKVTCGNIQDGVKTELKLYRLTPSSLSNAAAVSLYGLPQLMKQESSSEMCRDAADIVRAKLDGQTSVSVVPSSVPALAARALLKRRESSLTVKLLHQGEKTTSVISNKIGKPPLNASGAVGSSTSQRELIRAWPPAVTSARTVGDSKDWYTSDTPTSSVYSSLKQAPVKVHQSLFTACNTRIDDCNPPMSLHSTHKKHQPMLQKFVLGTPGALNTASVIQVENPTEPWLLNNTEVCSTSEQLMSTAGIWNELGIKYATGVSDEEQSAMTETSTNMPSSVPAEVPLAFDDEWFATSPEGFRKDNQDHVAPQKYSASSVETEVALVCAVPGNFACDHVLSNHGKHLDHLISSSAHHHITSSPGQNVNHIRSSPGQNIMFNLGQNKNYTFSPSSNKLTDVMFSASSVFAANASKPGAPSTKCPVPIVIAPLGDGCAYDDEQEDNCHSVPPSHASLSQEHMDSVEDSTVTPSKLFPSLTLPLFYTAGLTPVAMVTPVPASNAQIPLNHPMLSPSFWMPESPLDLSLPCHGTPVSVDKLENDGLTSDETQTDSEHETWDLDGDVIAWRIRDCESPVRSSSVFAGRPRSPQKVVVKAEHLASSRGRSASSQSCLLQIAPVSLKSRQLNRPVPKCRRSLQLDGVMDMRQQDPCTSSVEDNVVPVKSQKRLLTNFGFFDSGSSDQVIPYDALVADDAHFLPFDAYLP